VAKKNQFRYTDEELIAKFQKGDERAYLELVKRYKDRLINFVFRFVGNPEQAEDIVQDTFLKLYTSADMYREVAKFSTWIYTIAGNLAKTELRKRRRRPMLSIHEMGLDDKEYEIPSVTYNPERDSNSDYSEKEIQTAIVQLPEQFRTVIILRDIQELSYDEISKIVDVPEGTVKSRINRGRQRLQEILKELKPN
jgi:RNA polymerase sigma-70 factor, ECF subfamily